MEIGTNYTTGRRVQFETSDRRRHLYVIGKTGVGKSTVLKNMIAQDLQAGNGLAFFDPHGQEAEEVLGLVPQSRARDVIILDPSDNKRPVRLNLIKQLPEARRGAYAKIVTGIFKHVWKWTSETAPLMERYMLHGIRTLLDIPGSDLLDLHRLYTNPIFRYQASLKALDPLNRAFWLELQEEDPDDIKARSGSLITRLDKFLFSPSIRHMVCHHESSIDIRKILDTRQILIVKLSKGAISEDDAALIGSLIFNEIVQAAFSREDTPEDDRVDFYTYLDEWQNYANQSIATTLSEARKYRLNLTLANQYGSQVPEEMLDAVFGNVGSIIAMRVSPPDAEPIADEIGLPNPDELVQLPSFRAVARILRNGNPSNVIRLQADEPAQPVNRNVAGVKRNSRERYGRGFRDTVISIEERMTPPVTLPKKVKKKRS